MPIAAAVVALLLLAAPLLGCGEEDSPSRSPQQQEPHLTVAEVESELERGSPAVVRTAGSDTSVDREGLVDVVEYEGQSNRQFELFVWETVAVARRELPSLLADARAQHGDDATMVPAANTVAVFPGRPRSVDAYRAAAEAMSRLGAACIRGRDAEERLRRLCFGNEAVPPAGEGVDRSEAEEEGDSIVVGGLRYDPVLARRLNPDIAGDQALVSGRAPPEGTAWFGVFLRVCNERGSQATPSARLALVDASGERRMPRELPRDNAFAYAPEPIEPDDCLPPTGSVAERAHDGALVLFAVARDYLGNRPIALEVSGDRGSPRRVVLDI